MLNTRLAGSVITSEVVVGRKVPKDFQRLGPQGMRPAGDSAAEHRPLTLCWRVWQGSRAPYKVGGGVQLGGVLTEGGGIQGEHGPVAHRMTRGRRAARCESVSGRRVHLGGGVQLEHRSGALRIMGD